MKVLLFTVVCVGLSWCLPSGPPARESVCRELKPDSTAPHMQQQGTGGYTLGSNLQASSTSGYLSYSSGGMYTSKFLLNIT